MFANTERLVEEMEQGIGIVALPFRGFEPAMRLRVSGVCGIASLALHEHLKRQNIQSEVVISTPQPTDNPDLQHVFVVADIKGQQTIVDPSYTTLLADAGMTPGYVAFGGVDRFPPEKIATFSVYDEPAFAEGMKGLASYCIKNYEPINTDPYFNNTVAFEGLSDDEIFAWYEQIWNLDNVAPYRPTEFYTLKGKALANLINPEHARILPN